MQSPRQPLEDLRARLLQISESANKLPGPSPSAVENRLWMWELEAARVLRASGSDSAAQQLDQVWNRARTVTDLWHNQAVRAMLRVPQEPDHT